MPCLGSHRRGVASHDFGRYLWRRAPICWPAIVATLIAVAVGATGCRNAARSDHQVAAPVDPSRVLVEHLLADLSSQLRTHAEAAATSKALSTYLSRAVRQQWDARVDGGIKYADLFEKLYDRRSYHKAFAQSDGLTGRGQAVLEVLLEADRHGLDGSSYHVERIQTLGAELDRLTDGHSQWDGIQLRADEANDLVHWIKGHQLDPNDPQTRLRVLTALVGASPRPPEDPAASHGGPLDSPAPRITERIGTFIGNFERNAEVTAELELRVADGALRYARDLKHFNLARQDWRDLRDAGGSKALIYGRLEETYQSLVDAAGADAADVLTDLWPSHPQYKKLLGALTRYRAIAADGGWSTVHRTHVRLGRRSNRVGELRKRLEVEGFLSQPADPSRPAGRGGAAGAQPPPASGGSRRSARAPSAGGSKADDRESPDPNVVDKQLIEAVKSYQETHQFRPDGEPTSGFWRSLNVPVARRIDQIELTLQRWRESHYQGEQDFIMVNIPGFHVEVFDAGQRVMRFRVVTGNNHRVCDRDTGKWTYPNATPIQMAQLDHIIVNPYWYVPQRIIDDELEPKMKRDPDYLAKNNYEKVTLGGKETIRQKPGDDNALGRVKFIFPNRHNTYMHDTPSKQYFDYPVRAFSHGCMRLQKPFELARFLLSHDPNGKKYDFDRLLESGEQEYIDLADKLPVFTEYYTVRVDEHGRPHFLADIYRYDHARLAQDGSTGTKLQSCRRRRRPPADKHSRDEPDDVDSDLGP